MQSEVAIDPLTPGDLPFAQSVRTLAGWNQTDRDWLRLLDSDPEGCFLARTEGHPAGTATTTRFGNDLAWIGMILVHPDFRRRKIATTLMEHCLTYLLTKKRMRCVKLDATPAGRGVYEKIGFQAELDLARWEGKTIQVDEIDSTGEFDLAPIRDLDKRAFGTGRGTFLARLAADSERTLATEDGFGMIREGSHAAYLGPVISGSAASGVSIIRALLRAPVNRPVYWDILEDNREAVRLAETLGFQRQRPLHRMWTGTENVAGDPALQWAIGGLETG